MQAGAGSNQIKGEGRKDILQPKDSMFKGPEKYGDSVGEKEVQYGCSE